MSYDDKLPHVYRTIYINIYLSLFIYLFTIFFMYTYTHIYIYIYYIYILVCHLCIIFVDMNSHNYQLVGGKQKGTRADP